MYFLVLFGVGVYGLGCFRGKGWDQPSLCLQSAEADHFSRSPSPCPCAENRSGKNNVGKVLNPSGLVMAPYTASRKKVLWQENFEGDRGTGQLFRDEEADQHHGKLAHRLQFAQRFWGPFREWISFQYLRTAGPVTCTPFHRRLLIIRIFEHGTPHRTAQQTDYCIPVFFVFHVFFRPTCPCK